MNQKGIAFIPIILWSIVILGSVFIAQDTVKRGYINMDSPYISKETPTPQPTIFPTPLPTYKPSPTPTPKSPQGQVKGVTQTDQNSKQIQGRTGRIIKYKEYCKGGQEISVYENELITRKALSDGKTYSMTKDDWDCSDRNSAVAKQPTNIPPQTTNTYTTPYYTPYSPPQYYTCTICYSSLGTCSTYTSLYKTKEECDAAQQKMNQYATPSTQTTPDNSRDQHNTQVTSCQNAVRSRYEGLLQSCNQYGGSTAEGCRQIYTDQRQREYDACGTIY